MNTLFLRIATYGPVGYYKGSGTLATVATIPLVVLLQHVVPSLWGQVVCIFFGIVSAFFIVQRVLPFFSEEDPSAIVIDEGIGTFIVLSGLKLNFFSVVIGFIAFRCFDIWKPCGIKQLEKLPGAWGVMLDDIAAGLLGAVVLRLCVQGMEL